MARVCCDQDSLSSHGCRSWASVKTRCRTHAKVIKDDVDDSAGEILYYVRASERVGGGESSGNAEARVTPINTTRRFIMCRER
jgi:hypothetical protein